MQGWALSAPVSVVLNSPAVVGRRCSLSVPGPPALPCLPGHAVASAQACLPGGLLGCPGGRWVGVREVLELTCPGIPGNKGSEELGRQPMSTSKPRDAGCIPSTVLETFSSPRPARRPTTSSSCRIVS